MTSILGATANPIDPRLLGFVPPSSTDVRIIADREASLPIVPEVLMLLEQAVAGDQHLDAALIKMMAMIRRQGRQQGCRLLLAQQWHRLSTELPLRLAHDFKPDKVGTGCVLSEMRLGSSRERDQFSILKLVLTFRRGLASVSFRPLAIITPQTISRFFTRALPGSTQDLLSDLTPVYRNHSAEQFILCSRGLWFFTPAQSLDNQGHVVPIRHVHSFVSWRQIELAQQRIAA